MLQISNISPVSLTSETVSDSIFLAMALSRDWGSSSPWPRPEMLIVSLGNKLVRNSWIGLYYVICYIHCYTIYIYISIYLCWYAICTMKKTAADTVQAEGKKQANMFNQEVGNQIAANRIWDDSQVALRNEALVAPPLFGDKTCKAAWSGSVSRCGPRRWWRLWSVPRILG